MFITTKPTQTEAEHHILEALHVAANYWDEADTHYLVKQLEGATFTNITISDFEEALSHYEALNCRDTVSVFDLAAHYDEAPGTHLYGIREEEIEQDLTAALNTILSIGGYKPITIRRIHQLNEELNDAQEARWAA